MLKALAAEYHSQDGVTKGGVAVFGVFIALMIVSLFATMAHNAYNEVVWQFSSPVVRLIWEQQTEASFEACNKYATYKSDCYVYYADREWLRIKNASLH
jgi:hypothetical protein